MQKLVIEKSYTKLMRLNVYNEKDILKRDIRALLYCCGSLKAPKEFVFSVFKENGKLVDDFGNIVKFDSSLELLSNSILDVANEKRFSKYMDFDKSSVKSYLSALEKSVKPLNVFMDDALFRFAVYDINYCLAKQAVRVNGKITFPSAAWHEYLCDLLKLEFDAGVFCGFSEKKICEVFHGIFADKMRNFSVESLMNELLDNGKLVKDEYGCVYSNHPSWNEARDMAKHALVQDIYDDFFGNDGKGFSVLAKKHGLTPDRERQLVHEYPPPLVKETRYFWLIFRYKMSPSDFAREFHVPMNMIAMSHAVCHYKQSHTPIDNLVNSGDIPEPFREKLKHLFPKRVFFAGDKRSHFRPFNRIVISFLHSYRGTPLTPEELHQKALEYAKENNIYLAEPPSVDSTINLSHAVLLKDPLVINVRHFACRGYDPSEIDFDDLSDSLHFHDYMDSVMSSDFFFKKYPKVMKKYDIRDCYELHNILKKNADKLSLPLSFGRTPNIIIGNANAEKQLVDFMHNNSSCSSYEIAKKYSSAYGFRADVIEAKVSYIRRFYGV